MNKVLDLNIFFFFAAALHSLWDLSSPTRGEPRPEAVKASNPHHWTARELPEPELNEEAMLQIIVSLKNIFSD